MTSTSTMPGLIPHRRNSDEMDEDQELADGSVTPSTLMSNSSKRPRLDQEEISEPEDDILPHSYRADPRTTSRGGSITNGNAPDVHQPGSIVRIKVKNFVTYTAAEFKCRPSLNMIIGPNGTGKSTIVCAICLGLGFPPLCLGRAKEIGEYVKHGHRQAEIEIELAAGPRQKRKNPIIRCAIKREGSKTSWYINGSSTTRKEVRQLVESFHIQIDNLCQFLPQDRVVEFSRLTPVELLDSTQKAVAPDRMTQWHNELKGLGKDRMKLLQDQNSSKEHLSQLQTRQNQQKADVERMTERKVLLDKVRVLEKGRPALRYQAERVKYREMRSRNQEAKDEMRDLEKEVEPSLRRLRDKEKYGKDLDRLLKYRKQMVNKFENNISILQTKLEEHKTKLADCDKQIEEERKSEQTNKQERRRVEQIISRLRSRLDSEPIEFNPSNYNERIREKDRELRDLTPQYHDLQDQKGHLKNKVKATNNELDDAKRELKSLQSETGQQLNKLQQLSKDTARALGWIQQNQALFKDKVYGPPIIECSIKDSRYADAIESLLQRDDLIALTVTNVEDFRTLEDNLRGKQHLKDVVVRSVTRGLDHFQPPISREALVEYGLDYWAIDLLAGPDPVLTMLCDNPRLHRTAITLKQHNDAQYEKLSSESSSISTWIAGRQAYRINRRREYGSQASSTMVSQVRPARFWSKQSVDSAVERNLKQMIAEKTGELGEMEGQYRQLQAEDKELQDRKKAIEEERDRLKEEKEQKQKVYADFLALPTRISTEEIKLKGLVEAAAEFHENRMAILGQQEKLSLARGQFAIDYAIAANTLLKSHNELFEAELLTIEAESELSTLKERNAEVTKLLEARKAEIKQLDRDVRTQKIICEKLMKEFKEARDNMSEEEDAFLEEWCRQNGSIVELNAEIESINGRIELLHEGNPGILQQYEKRQREIEKLEDRVNNFDAELARLNESISRIRGQWEPELEKLVSEISDAFSYNFAQIGCAGQVNVSKNDEDFSQWAIRIEVKFRENEQLSILDSHRQSGGERAVSTIFYLMALQSLARAPFRVVDEINQGMDPRNERMVHERMVDIACSENTSQYFLITPKLLSGLKYHERMAVHTIYSGETMPENNNTLDFGRLADLALRVVGKVN